ncbi:sugar O-acetyltransferase [Lentilactobacillus sp. SPB1-3]|uniref:Sugar O-acetyltransferase n=1 Tax=Lentilactobacillus terminaliae TaxID=3003483 RepID=A0ACD5DF84_9LACO|nr:sugar O-acetyltransferase [Lentilactobacillus sp. SPB1-3]MCZ0976567.1 sugar O-acetyltransferase [Lentilactobacillus sp. SPB1-3]
MNEAERKAQHLVYRATDPTVMAKQAEYLDEVFAYNQVKPSDHKTKSAMLKKMFAEVGHDCYIETPFYANFGGHNVHLGNGVYANFNLTLTDDTDIYIDDRTMIGPNVTLATAGHPIKPVLREEGYQYDFPIHIGKNVWLGANVVVCPGVTIGDNTVIGAGSVVTKDIPANVVAVGSPCKVQREIGEHDNEYYFKNHKLDI